MTMNANVNGNTGLSIFDECGYGSRKRKKMTLLCCKLQPLHHFVYYSEYEELLVSSLLLFSITLLSLLKK